MGEVFHNFNFDFSRFHSRNSHHVGVIYFIFFLLEAVLLISLQVRILRRSLENMLSAINTTVNTLMSGSQTLASSISAGSSIDQSFNSD